MNKLQDSHWLIVGGWGGGEDINTFLQRGANLAAKTNVSLFGDVPLVMFLSPGPRAVSPVLVFVANPQLFPFVLTRASPA